MGGVPHVEGGLNSELYAVPVKRRQPKDQKNNAILQNNTQEKPSDVDNTDSEDKDENLPPGWQKHEGRSQNRDTPDSKRLVSNQYDCFGFNRVSCIIAKKIFLTHQRLVNPLEKLLIQIC